MTALLLKAMPEDIRNYLLDLQNESKKKKDRQQYSLESTVYKIIREHKENSNR